MKTSRKEDWVVVVGVVLLATVVAVVFLLRNKSGEEGGTDSSKQQAEQIAVEAAVYVSTDPTKGYLEAKRALELDSENGQATQVLFNAFYKAEHRPLSKELGFYPQIKRAYVISYTPYLVIEHQDKQVLIQMETEKIEEMAGNELDTSAVKEQWFRERVFGKGATERVAVSEEMKRVLINQFSYWLDLSIQAGSGKITVPESYEAINGEFLHYDGEYQLVRKLQGGGVVAVTKEGRVVKWKDPKPLYLPYQKRRMTWDETAIYFDDEGTVVQFGSDSSLSILTRYGNDPGLPITAELMRKKLADWKSGWLRPGDPEIQAHHNLVFLEPFWDDIFNQLEIPGGFATTPLYKFSPEGSSLLVTFEEEESGQFLNGFIWLPLTSEEIIGWTDYALEKPFSTTPL